MRERVVGEGPVGLDGVGHDLGHRVRRDQVDPLERRHDRSFRRPEGRHDGRQPDVRAPSRGGTIGHPPEMGQATLTARRRGLGQVRLGRPWPTVTRLPGLDDEAGVDHPVGQLATDRDLDPDEVDAGPDEAGGLLERGVDVRFAERDAQPRPGRLAEDVDRLATHGPLRVDPLDGGGRQAPGLDLGHGAPVGLAQQLRLEREVDRPRGDVQRELLRLEVVLEQGHRERQRDARPEAVRVAGQPAIDGGTGQRPARRIEPADPEQAQDRPLLADRRRGPGPRAPRPGQRLCSRHERVERPPIRGHAGQYGVTALPVVS